MDAMPLRWNAGLVPLSRKRLWTARGDLVHGRSCLRLSPLLSTVVSEPEGSALHAGHPSRTGDPREAGRFRQSERAVSLEAGGNALEHVPAASSPSRGGGVAFLARLVTETSLGDSTMSITKAAAVRRGSPSERWPSGLRSQATTCICLP